MKSKALIRRFDELGKTSEKKGYKGDSAEYWFRGEVLVLLNKLIEEFKGIEKQMKYLWQTLDDLKEDKNV